MVKFKRDYYVEQEPYNIDFVFRKGYSYFYDYDDKYYYIWNIDHSVEIVLDEEEFNRYIEVE